jgi:hypothetical protein
MYNQPNIKCTPGGNGPKTYRRKGRKTGKRSTKRCRAYKGGRSRARQGGYGAAGFDTLEAARRLQLSQSGAAWNDATAQNEAIRRYELGMIGPSRDPNITR